MTRWAAIIISLSALCMIALQFSVSEAYACGSNAPPALEVSKVYIQNNHLTIDVNTHAPHKAKITAYITYADETTTITKEFTTSISPSHTTTITTDIKIQELDSIKTDFPVSLSIRIRGRDTHGGNLSSSSYSYIVDHKNLDILPASKKLDLPYQGARTPKAVEMVKNNPFPPDQVEFVNPTVRKLSDDPNFVPTHDEDNKGFK